MALAALVAISSWRAGEALRSDEGLGVDAALGAMQLSVTATVETLAAATTSRS